MAPVANSSSRQSTLRQILACVAIVLIGPATAAERSSFEPERFFAGKTRSSGIVVDNFGQATDHITGTTSGHREPDGSTVFEQTIRMQDGSVRRRSFRLIRSGLDTVDVTGSEVVGVAHGIIRGDTLFLASNIRSHRSNPFSTLHFDQSFTLRPDGRSLTIHSEVSVLGIMVRTIDESYLRAGRVGG